MSGDIRTTGFRTLTPVSAVLDEIVRFTGQCGAETIPIQKACGRVLTDSIVSAVNVPNFRRAAMDGFAVRACDVPGALTIVGSSRPGRPFAGDVLPGQAVAVMTGSPVPDDADTVVPVERCRAAESTVEVSASFPAGKHVASVGEDVTAGHEVLKSFRVLRPQDIGLLSSLGITEVSVFTKPRVKILVTGGELLPPGAPPAEFHIADSNSVMLAAFVERDGGTVATTVRVPDDPERIRAEMAADGWDLLLVSGGTSVGADDHAPRTMRELTASFVHGLDMRPGMPTGYGTFPDGRRAHLLPGNPVACLFAYDLLARLTLRKLGGLPTDWPYPTATVPLASALESKAGRVDYVRVTLAFGMADLVAQSGAANLSSAVRADGFIIVGADVKRLEAGAEVTMYYYR